MSCADKTGRFKTLLLVYAEQGLDPLTRGEVRAHLEDCPDCRIRLDEIYQALDVFTLVNKNVWGEKSECPPSEELVALSESPGNVAPLRIEALKTHLRECMACNDLFKRLRDLAARMRSPDFLQQRPMPEKLCARIARVTSDRVRAGAAAGLPVVITLGNVCSFADARVCREATGREIPAENDGLPVIQREISGVITDTSGGPVRGETVSLLRNSNPLYRMRTSAHGHFHFKNLTRGFYEIHTRGQQMLVIYKG